MKSILSNTPNNFLFGHMTDEPGLDGAFVKSYYDGVSRAAGFRLVPFLLLGSFYRCLDLNQWVSLQQCFMQLVLVKVKKAFLYY